jgi:hypothetical protein
VIPSALVEKYLFLQAPAPRVCERSVFDLAWVRLPRGALIGRVNKSCLPHHNRVLQAAKFSATTTVFIPEQFLKCKRILAGCENIFLRLNVLSVMYFVLHKT